MSAPTYNETVSDAGESAEEQPQRSPFRYLLWYLPAVCVVTLIVSYALPSNYQRMAFWLCVLGLYVLVRLGMWAYGRRTASRDAEAQRPADASAS